MNRGKYLLKNTVLYSISTFSTRIISFLMVSFYTAVLSVEIYGTIDIIFATISLLLPIIALSINNAELRFLLDKKANKGNVFAVGCAITAAGTLLTVIVALIINIWVKNEYIVLAAILLVFEEWYMLMLEFVRGTDKNRLYALSNILLAIFISAFNLLFLGVYDLEIYGYLFAYIFAYGIMCIILCCFGKPNIVLKNVERSRLFPTMREMLKYCVFLIPNSIFWWITTASDKYLIVYLIGPAFNGIYSVANKIPTIITYTFNIFIQAWQLSSIKESGSKDEEKFVNNVFRALCALLMIGVSAVLMILKPFISIYVSSEYYISWQSAAILLFSSMFNILSSFVGIRYVVMKKNSMNMCTTMIGAGVNIVLNIILIPTFQLIGAAIATYASYFVVFVVRVIDTQKYLRLHIPKQFILYFILLTAQLVLLFLNNIISIIMGVIVVVFIGITNRSYLEDAVKRIQIYRREKRHET